MVRGVPAEVRDLAGVPAVDEQQLGRPVLRVLRVLLIPYLAQIPYVDTSVRAAGSQDGLIEWRPGYLVDPILVPLQDVHGLVELPQIPQVDHVVTAAGGQQVLRIWVEGDAVHLHAHPVSTLHCLGGRPGLPRIPQQQLGVVPHRPEQVCHVFVPVHVFHHVCVAILGAPEERLHIHPTGRIGDIPQAYYTVIGPTQQLPRDVWVPAQPEALLLVPHTAVLRLTYRVRGEGRVLRIVKHKYGGRRRFSSNNKLYHYTE